MHYNYNYFYVLSQFLLCNLTASTIIDNYYCNNNNNNNNNDNNNNNNNNMCFYVLCLSLRGSRTKWQSMEMADGSPLSLIMS